MDAIQSTAAWTILGCVVSLAVFVSCSGAGDEENSPEASPSIILVTFDTTRWDHTGASGRRRLGQSLTPNFDALAAEGRAYPLARCGVPLTLPSHATLLTGLEPPQHGLRENDGFVMPPPRGRRYETLAEVLAERSYSTAAFVSAQPLARRFGLAAGFQHYDDDFGLVEGGDLHFPERSARATTDRAIAWLKVQKSEKPVFLWVHYFDPHHPLRKHEGISDAILADGGTLYEGEIQYMDREMGRLFQALRSAGQWEDSVVAVFGDHGESLGEHGEPTHGYLVYDSTIRIPMALKLPKGVEGSLQGETGSTLDFAPTVTGLLGAKLSQDDQLFGRDLTRPEEGPRRQFAESMYSFRQFHWSAPRSYSEGPWKLIRAAGRSELYRIDRDPAEARDLSAAEPERLRSLEDGLRRYRARMQSLLDEDPRSRLDGELSASGYLQGAGAGVPAEPDDLLNRSLPHPADGMATVRSLDRLRSALEQLASPNSVASSLIAVQSALEDLDRRAKEENPAALFWRARARLKLAGFQDRATQFPADARIQWLGEAQALFAKLRTLRPEDPRAYAQAQLAHLARLELPGSDAEVELRAARQVFREQERRGLSDGLAFALQARLLFAAKQTADAVAAMRKALSLETRSRPAWKADLSRFEAALGEGKAR